MWSKLPFGRSLEYEMSESSCGGNSGSTSGPPRVTRVERSPASREAAQASEYLEGCGRNVSLHHTFEKMALFAFKEKLRWAWLLVST